MTEIRATSHNVPASADPHLSASAIRRGRRGSAPVLVPGEAVLLMSAPLPVRGTARRRAALPFAIEDRLALPLDRMHVALAPGGGSTALAAALPARIMALAAEAAGDAPLVPESMAIPVPDASDGPAWTVWCAGRRAVVRASDGTGFAAPADALGTLWTAAGRPRLDIYGETPSDLREHSRAGTPPPPAPADLAFDLRQGAFAPADEGWGAPLRTAAVVLALGAAGHLGLAVLDARALSRIAAEERAKAARMLDERLPGAPIGAGPAALMARLAPRAPEPPRGARFLPLLDATSAVLAGQDGVSARRLSWAEDGGLSIRLQAGGMGALQQAEAALVAAGLSVEGGVATASEGGAEIEMRISEAPS